MKHKRRKNGFTLLELMIVIAIIFILIGMAAGRYDRSVQRARETALKTDLQTMRTAIDTYTLDKLAAPNSLDELVSQKYLRDVPVDPMTGQKDWNPQFEDVMLSPQQSGTGLTDVHSASQQVSPFDGTAYKDW
jgi:general secretion pathway protein G